MAVPGLDPGIVPAIPIKQARRAWNRDVRVKPAYDARVSVLAVPGLDPGLVPAIPNAHTRRVREFYVYILASRPGGALYVGVTNNLVRRVYEHKNKMVEGFTKRYGIDRLVHFEIYQTANQAIQREKNIKHWPRVWKTRLIAQNNDTWRDLYDDIAQP